MKEINLLALGKHDCGAYLDLEDYQINGVIDNWKCPSCQRVLNYTHFGRPSPNSLHRTMVIGTDGEWTPMVPAKDFEIRVKYRNKMEDLLVQVPERMALKVLQEAA